MVVKEARIIGSRCGPFEDAIMLLRRKLIRVRELITATYKLEEGVEAFKKSLSRESVKVHITP
jgi:alcohol dehydrogenase